jgi:hypothetical protein
MHHKRVVRTGSPVRGERAETCSVAGCSRDAKTRGWCHAHYQRWRAHGDVRADVPLRAVGECEVDGCDRKRFARGHCSTHYKRLVTTGSARPEEPIRIVTGRGWANNGYWVVPVPVEDRHLSRGEPWLAEHRLVVAKELGRALTDDENVHHRNGDRSDNRLDNLELWSTSQPRGQRVTDKVAHALEMLRRYRPELLAPTSSGTIPPTSAQRRDGRHPDAHD